jgi:hypothetical protein
MKTAVLFLKPNEHTGNDLQQNTTDSTQGTYLELHTLYPYENSDGCISTNVTVPVKVLTMRNLSDLKRSDIFIGYIDKSLRACSIYFYINKYEFDVYSNKDSKYPANHFIEWEIELVNVIGKAIDLTPQINDFKNKEKLCVYVGAASVLIPINSTFYHFIDYTRSYLSVGYVWYTPCAVKYQKWSRSFNIFSVDMWICFALSLVLAVITVRCISN